LDWQHGGTPVAAIADLFGSWSTATFLGSPPTYVDTYPPTTNNWVLGPGSDSPAPGFGALGNEGYGSEVRWNAKDLGLSPGTTYRFQILTHDGDQNKTGGDVGEFC